MEKNNPRIKDILSKLQSANGGDNTINICIPKFEDNVLRLRWENGFFIKCQLDEYGNVVLTANSEGLVSLARHLLTLAQNNVPEYTHLHLDEYDSLESGSNELIIVKRQDPIYWNNKDS